VISNPLYSCIFYKTSVR